MAGASHAAAETASHPLLEAELPRHPNGPRQRTEHRHGAAGIHVIIIRTSVRKHIGDEASHAARTVRRSDRHIDAERLELLGIEDFRSRIETEHHRHPTSFGQQPLGQVVERRHPHAAAHQQRPFGFHGGRETVSQSGQHIELPARRHTGHLRGTFADYLINKRYRMPVVIAHRNGSAEKPARQLDVHELPRRRQVLRIALYHHPVNRLRQRLV